MSDDSTLGDVRPVEGGPRPTLVRRLLVALLTAIVVAGAAGLYVLTRQRMSISDLVASARERESGG